MTRSGRRIRAASSQQVRRGAGGRGLNFDTMVMCRKPHQSRPAQILTPILAPMAFLASSPESWISSA
jgi:hypothetical protein